MSTFLDTLAEQGVINRYQIDDILEKAEEFDGNIDDALSVMNIDGAMARSAKSQFYGVPEATIDLDALNHEIVKYIPQDAAQTYRMMSFGVADDGTILVGMVDPGNGQAQNALQFIFSKNKTPYRVHVISYDDFKLVMNNLASYGASFSNKDSQITTPDDVQDLEDALDSAGRQAGGAAENKIVEDSPIAKTVGVILRNAIDGGVSDIHIEHSADAVKVRFRVDGDLHTSYTLPKAASPVIVARIKILAKLKLDEKRKPQDGRFFAKVEGRKVDFRVSTMPTFFGEKVVIRILDPGKGITELEKTGMHMGHLEIVRRAIRRPYGMILVTGPTGSGKSTTLRSMLLEVDKERKNVVSLEDPIEYNIGGMNQSQVRPEIGYTFANGLRSILRQDPDVIMVGEIRDKETAQLAIQAALTGHLVLSTLHTNTSIGAVPRLIDMGVDPYLIAPTLILTMAQRLAKGLCPNGGQQVALEGGRRAIVDQQFEDLPEQFKQNIPFKDTVYEPLESPDCPGGTRGRVGVFEMLEITDEIERMILEKPTEQDIYKLARSKGMLTMKEDAIIKSMQGLIPWSEVNKL